MTEKREPVTNVYSQVLFCFVYIYLYFSTRPACKQLLVSTTVSICRSHMSTCGAPTRSGFDSRIGNNFLSMASMCYVSSPTITFWTRLDWSFLDIVWWALSTWKGSINLCGKLELLTLDHICEVDFKMSAECTYCRKSRHISRFEQDLQWT